MFEFTLPDKTSVRVQWCNPDPNHPGCMHTNGPAPAWLSLDGGRWLRMCYSDRRLRVTEVNEIIQLVRDRNELIQELQLTDMG